MKKTQWVDFFQRIQRSKVSFIAILLFVAFGVALYTGIKWTEPSFYYSMETEYNALKLRDVELIFSSGLSEDRLSEFQELPEVSEIEGIYTAYQYLRYNGERYQAKIRTVTQDIDLLRVNEGKLPEKGNEIAVETCWASEHGISVGDTILLEHDGNDNAHLLCELLDGKIPDANFHNDDGMQVLLYDTFTVTSLVDIPAGLITLSSQLEASPVSPFPVSLSLFVSPSAFDKESFPGYTGALVRSESLRGMKTTDEAYKTAAIDFVDLLRPTAERLCEEQAERIDNTIRVLKTSPMGLRYADIEIPTSSVALLTRENLGCVAMTGIIGEMMRKLCINFGSAFIIIGILVCYSTLSRLVYQETVLSGTKKALGFFDREITCSFLLYAMAVTLLGVVTGALLSVLMVQPMLLGVLSDTYLFSAVHISFRWKEISVICLLESAAMIICAWLACHKTLRRSPLSLLAGEEPPSGDNRLFEHSRLYQRLPLLYKCIVRNLLNDRRRVIGTLIGIMGCTALTVSSITFDLAVTRSMDRQFGVLQRFDSIIYYSPDNGEADEKIASILSGEGTDYAQVMMSRGALITPKGKSISVILLADDAAFGSMLEPTSTNRTPLEIGNGALISCAFVEQYGLEPGDTVNFQTADGKKYDLPIGASMEYYIQLPRLVMTEEEYETEFGLPASENVFLVEKGSRTLQQISDSLSGVEGYIGTSDYYADTMKIQSILNLIVHAVMILYLVMSMLIALFVVLDILLLFVMDKKRELITLAINGYPTHYTRRYISIDSVFLSVIGILGGLAIGIALGAWDISTMESDACYFLHGINPVACAVGAAFTALLTSLMTSIALRRVDQFQLSDIKEV